MKRIKKIMALVIAMAMVVGMMSISSFAATGELTPDTTMTVGGLDVNDEVTFVKLIKWTPSVGWEWADGVTAAATSAGVTLPDLKTITGEGSTDGVISAANGGILAQVAQKMADSAKTTVTVESGTTASLNLKDNPTAQDQIDYLGLYVALVKPGKAEYVYNPVFVAADYNPDNSNTNSFTVEEGTLSYDDAALAKKKQVNLTKTSGTDTDVQYDVKVGDTIPFTIDSIIPAFSSSYVNPQYVITDKMDSGLALDTNTPVVVKIREVGTTSWTTVTDGTEYDYATTSDGFTVTFKGTAATDFLKTNATPKEVQVTYSAKVTSIPDTNVVQKENTATVKFSNNPGNSSDYSLLEDKTNHYTFSLDANMLGKTDWENSELVKIGLSANGEEITQSKLSNGTDAGILEGAKFGLYTTISDDKKTVSNLYTNSEYGINGEFTSDSNGKLNISGLDAGTYYLKEISAPDGYIKSDDIYEIVITPHYQTVNAGSYKNADNILVNYDAYDYLESYDVKITNLRNNEAITSDFQISNSGTEKKIAVSTSGDMTTKLNNTRGTELPSTGGIGTTIFYVVGAILVIGAGVVLITRRRMGA